MSYQQTRGMQCISRVTSSLNIENHGPFLNEAPPLTTPSFLLPVSSFLFPVSTVKQPAVFDPSCTRATPQHSLEFVLHSEEGPQVSLKITLNLLFTHQTLGSGQMS